jgi:hypothetical protein
MSHALTRKLFISSLLNCTVMQLLIQQLENLIPLTGVVIIQIFGLLVGASEYFKCKAQIKRWT